MKSSTPFKEIPLKKEILMWFLIATIIGVFLWLVFSVYDDLTSVGSLKELIIYLAFTYFVFVHIFVFQFVLKLVFKDSLSKFKRIWNEAVEWLAALAGFFLGIINLNWFGSCVLGLFYPGATYTFPDGWLTYFVILFFVVGLIASFILSHLTMRLNIGESYRILYEQERLQKEMDTAREMQMGLMPDKDPDIDGFSISGVCLPATETGGDCYDYLWLDDARSLFGIAVTDVSGKGLKAAMTAVMAIGLIHRESGSNRSPSEILQNINRPMVRKTEKSTFAAMLFATIDIRNKSLTFANAGQIPPLLLRDGKVESLAIDGVRLPLGIKSDIEYEERTISLQHGDLLLFYTDGVSETNNSGKEMFGNERIKQVLAKQTKATGASTVIDALIDETKAFRKEHPQNDDLTIVAVRVE